jgi:hypothetical protein
MREKRKIFFIRIMGRKALLVSYTFDKTVLFSIFRELIGYMLWLVFYNFFDIFPTRERDFMKVVGNAPSSKTQEAN